MLQSQQTVRNTSAHLTQREMRTTASRISFRECPDLSESESSVTWQHHQQHHQQLRSHPMGDPTSPPPASSKHKGMTYARISRPENAQKLIPHARRVHTLAKPFPRAYMHVLFVERLDMEPAHATVGVKAKDEARAKAKVAVELSNRAPTRYPRSQGYP